MNWKFLNRDIGESFAYIPQPKNSILAGAAIGAGISALGGLASSALQNAANANLDEENREWQELMWNKNNEYNKPINQRKRLEEAGINPALAFSSGNTGVASSASTPNQHAPADFSALGSGFQGAAGMLLQGQSIEAQNRNLDADTEIKAQIAMTQYARDMASLEESLSRGNLSKGQYYLVSEQLRQLKDMFELTKAHRYAEIENLSVQSDLNRQLKLAKALEMELSSKRFFLDKRLTDAQIAAIAQQKHPDS